MSEDPYRRDLSAEPDAAGAPPPADGPADDAGPLLDAPPNEGVRGAAPAPDTAVGTSGSGEAVRGERAATPTSGSVAIRPADESPATVGDSAASPSTGRHASADDDTAPQDESGAGPTAAAAAAGAGAAVPAASAGPAVAATGGERVTSDTGGGANGPADAPDRTDAAPADEAPLRRGDDDAGAPDDAVASPSASRGRRRRILLAALAALLVLGLIALLVVFVPRLLGGDDDRRVEVVEAARENAIAITSYDHRTLDEDFERARSRTTGEFTNEFTQTTETIGPAIQQFQGTAEGEVLGSAVETLEGDTAQVLLFVNQTVQNANAPEGRVERTRIRMTMTEIDGEWLISDVRLV